MKEFKEALGQRESSGDYKAKNSLGYLGKYQFGHMALVDAGYKDKEGNWTGKNGVKSEEDFLNNPEAQEKAFDEYLTLQRKYLKHYGADKSIGDKFNGTEVTESGLAAAAHLIGAKGIADMLKSGKVKKDAYGTPATEYLEKFKGYDLDKTEELINKKKQLEDLQPMSKEENKLEELLRKKSEYKNGGRKYAIGTPEDDFLAESSLVDSSTDMMTDGSGYEPILEADNAPKDDKEEPLSEQPEMTLESLEKDYRDLMAASKEERKTAAWASAASQIASMIDKYSAEPVGIKPINFEADQASSEAADLLKLAKLKGIDSQRPMSEYQKQMLDVQRSQVELGKDRIKAQQEMLDKRLSAKKDKPEEPTFREKEEIKAEVKTDVQTKKENRALRADMEQSLPSLKEQEKNIKNALKLLKEAEEDFGPDTGPLDQYISSFTNKGQKLKQAMNKISLDSMVKMFSGMSKAIDSDAERAFFQSAQPGTDKYPNVNEDILKGLLENLQSLRSKTKNKLKEFTPSGERKEVPREETTPEKTVIKKEYSKSRDKTRITYSDGTTEIVDGRQ